MAVTQSEIAKAVGVSQTIVSDVIHGRLRGRVRPETRQKILQTARQMGYRPNALAQALRTRQSRQIVYLSVHDESREFPVLGEPDLAAVAKTLRAEGYRLLIEIAGDGEREANVLTEMIGTGVCDGGILRAYRGYDELWQELTAIPEPLVVIGQCPHPGLTSVAHDAPALMNNAIAQLRSLGHERIGLIFDPVRDIYHSLLLDAWKATFGSANGPWYFEGFDHKEISRTVESWLREPNGPTAIIAIDGAGLIAATEAIRSAGKTVGRDVDLHGLGSDYFEAFLEKGTWLSRVDVSVVGTRAAQELLAMLDGKPPAGPIRLQAPIVQVGDSPK